MYLNRNKNGYGWYAQVKTKEGEGENVGYINFSFKKGCEPERFDLTEYGSYDGDLFFRDRQGKERKVFPIVKEYNGTKHIEFKLLEVQEETDPFPRIQSSTTIPKWDLRPNEIIQDDLPFDE